MIKCNGKPHPTAISMNQTSEGLVSTLNREPKVLIKYHLVPVNKETIIWLSSITSDDSLRLLFAINRVDKRHLLRQDTLVFPDTFVSDLKMYSPFPDSIPLLKRVNKIIFYSYSIQAFAVYKNGVLLRWGPVSMGKQSTPTPTGLLFANWKSERTVSTIDPEWIMDWYFNLDNLQGVSMHEFDLPGYPASHACIRLLEKDAFWLFNWTDQWKLLSTIEIEAYGTPVIIFGKYPFGQRKPWFLLAKNNKAITVTPETIKSEVQKNIPLILERQAKRDSIYFQ